MEIDWLRREIDKLDDQIVQLLNRRATLVLEIGQIKKRLGLPVHSPGRENEVLGQVQGQNRGPLGDEAMRNIFQKILEEMRGLEEKTYSE